MLVVALLMAGCSDDGSPSSNDPDPPSFVELEGRISDLGQEIENLDATLLDDLPTTGAASYDGVVGIESENGVVLAGEMGLDVDFGAASGQLSGSIDNIVDESNDRWDGSLDISNGDIVDGGGSAGFDGEIDGTITDPDALTYDVEGVMVGAFVGSAAEYAGGFIGGEACAGEDCDAFSGVFILED